MTDLREYFENIVYYTQDNRRLRFTQQSPVMPDVWIQYGLNPGKQLDLLLVPDWHHTPSILAQAIKRQLKQDESNTALAHFRDTTDARPSAIAHNQNVVIATLWFDELIRAVLPLSDWWARAVAQVERHDDEDLLCKALEDPEILVTRIADAMEGKESSDDLPQDIAWLASVVGLIASISTKAHRRKIDVKGRDDSKSVELLQEHFKQHKTLAKALVRILDGIEPVAADDQFPLYSVNQNRETVTSLTDSVASVKGDAAQRVFKVKGKGIRWAIVDSGVDARHVAFRKRDSEGRLLASAFPKRGSRRGRGRGTQSKYKNNTRVVATYDFIHIRELLSADPDEVDEINRTHFPVLAQKKQRDKLKRLLRDLEDHVVDWERLEPFLVVPSEADKYRPPVNRHGTHVAGIVGADWREAEEWSPDDGDEPEDPPAEPRRGELTGVAPEIELYDLRVLGDDGGGNEFAIMSALQFVRDLNNRRDFVAIHGANLSFSIQHDVANYACGRTPVCEEAERLVGSGTMVVAAAGNNGRARYVTPSGTGIDDGFRTVSITDPGNAAAVLTVGATHRRDAHTYGVSYFSSRGPTGDGRLKPDLVAPGEKIKSTVPGDAEDRLDGTSMAAPHVSAAAALIMCRHPELIGQPRRIKEILCSTTIDLERERYFQGAGLLDILRALQSI